jgi:class 3 adenylate cyclase
MGNYFPRAQLSLESVTPDDDVVDLCRKRALDLVVLDVDGDEKAVDLCRQLKADPATFGLPVLAVGNSAARKFESFDAGVDEFLTRNMQREEFIIRVNSLIRVGVTRRASGAVQLQAEIKRLEHLRETFRRYVSPQVADHIIQAVASQSGTESVRVHASVLFVDMRGFTRISEFLSPGEVVPLLNEYFSLLTEIAFAHEGTVFNMAGDCLMVGFGVPVAQEDSPVRAVRAALEMIAGFEELAKHWKLLHGIETGIGIGINEGEVIAGNVGSHAYMSYTIVGDVVNIAARLCQRARAGEILFSETVKASLQRHRYAVHGVELPPMVLRGRTTPISLYCIPSEERKEILE